MNNILIVIDMQNDFIDGVLGSEQAKAIVSNVVNKIEKTDKSDLIICTWDSHCKAIDKSYIELQKFPRHCEIGTNGENMNSEVFLALKKQGDEGDGYCIVYKDTFAGKYLWRDIAEYIDHINEKAIITVIGLCTDICVISNALLIRSYFPENRVIVDASCCAGSSPEMHEAALKVMEMNCIEIINR